MNDLKDQVAIVTGAARGIGRAIACELAAAGAGVMVNYRSSKEEAEAVVAKITSAGGKAMAWAADVGDESAVTRLVETAIARLGGIDILVCNAGEIRDQLAASMTSDEWETVIRSNLSGTFWCIRAVLPRMIAQKKGSIVVLSSIAAEHGGRGHCNYAAAKGGLNAMVRSLAVELAPKKIRINAVSPGVILTAMSQRVRDLAGEEIRRQIPLRRFGEPEEVARAVRFLVSSDASYITGEVLHVTGGYGL
jgi:3-oxoacyl-[acyl-carrier protein] reductase